MKALISVSDKTGIVELAQQLHALGVGLISTGGTAKLLADQGLPVTEVAEVTGFPEMLDGRVKTLHPKVHGGLLARRDLPEHMAALQAHGIDTIDLLIVNLYPFEATVAKPGCTLADAIENIDIGGPAMVRASAKNHANVAIVVEPTRYPEIIAALGEGGTTLNQRRQLAANAFAHTARYDSAVADWFADELSSQWKAEAGQTNDNETKNPGFPAKLTLEGELVNILRYGENAHQPAAIYKSVGEGSVSGIAQARQLGGKEMSYNNYVDADAAVRSAYDHTEPAVAIIKHANPCGIAVGDSSAEDVIADAHAKAHLCDPLSAFGGVIAANRPVSLAMAKQIGDIFTEVIVAPGFELAALEFLLQKKNLRILELPVNYSREALEVKQISGGLLVQHPDQFTQLNIGTWKLVAGPKADSQTLSDLAFAWRAGRAVKSNGILLAKDGASVGVGMGQVNRVDSCRLATDRAGHRAKGSVASSDAFFPFKDGVEILIEAGVRAIVQPGGSMRDQEVIDAANAAGITMYFTGERHFYH